MMIGKRIRIKCFTASFHTTLNKDVKDKVVEGILVRKNKVG